MFGLLMLIPGAEGVFGVGISLALFRVFDSIEKACLGLCVVWWTGRFAVELLRLKGIASGRAPSPTCSHSGFGSSSSLKFGAGGVRALAGYCSGTCQWICGDLSLPPNEFMVLLLYVVGEFPWSIVAAGAIAFLSAVVVTAMCCRYYGDRVREEPASSVLIVMLVLVVAPCAIGAEIITSVCSTSTI